MITKDDLLAAMQAECDICIHLFERLPEGGLEYRPSEVQRTTLELLRYLSYHALAFSVAMIDDEWDTYTALAATAGQLAPEEFPAAMEAQSKGLAAAFGRITDEDLRSKKATVPWGATLTLGRALLDLPYRCLTSYRMQLFLYAKAAGNHDLATPNCFAGVDMKS